MPEGRFLQAFFFSVETFATIGYGHIYPVGIAANTVMTIESIVGLDRRRAGDGDHVRALLAPDGEASASARWP